MTALVETRGLTKTYGGLDANRDVDFVLPEGEVRALIGPNGAGKSTFVGMLCGRIPPSAGQVLFEGQDVTTLPAHRRIALGIAYTFQITSVFSRLSVEENVALAVRRKLGGDGAAAAAHTRDALGRVGLVDRGGQIAGDLSYGHQRLLEIAMGLGQQPRLFIMDEPTQGLAAAEIDGFLQLIDDLKHSTTILLIEHNMAVVMQAADRITVLDAGQVLAEGTPEEIQSDAAVQAAYLGTA